MRTITNNVAHPKYTKTNNKFALNKGTNLDCKTISLNYKKLTTLK